MTRPLHLLTLVTMATAARLVVDTGRSAFRVDAEYVSVTLDFMLVAVPPGIPRWYTLDTKHPRVLTLLRGLSPCYLRFGGSQADMTVLSNPPASILYSLPTALRLNTIYTSDLDLLVELTRATGCRLLYDLNLSVRYVAGWDPTNAWRTLSYMAAKGFGDSVDFQLGNEPDISKSTIAPPWPYPPVDYNDTPPGGVPWQLPTMLPGDPPLVPPPGGLSGEQIGADFRVLKQLLAGIPDFRSSRLVGADIATLRGLRQLLPGFLKTAGRNISATTFHHYYFNGQGAKPAEYINPEHFDFLRKTINIVKALVKDSPRKDIPIWIGETADAWNSGTQNVSDRYVSGFLWLDKLGLAAQTGVSVVMRQTFYGGFYGLIDGQLFPNPDYWVSYIHKWLVGRVVFRTALHGRTKVGNRKHWRPLAEKTNTAQPARPPATAHVRLYAHCTKPSAQYQRGSLTVFGSNLLNRTQPVKFDPSLAAHTVHQYLLTPADPGNLLSKTLAVNGDPLRLVDDVTFPVLKPVTIVPGTSGVHLPGLTMVFWVFPEAGLSVCVQQE